MAEVRLRYERRLDRDFNEASDDRWDFQQRYRAGVEAKHGESLLVRVVYQFSQTDGQNPASPYARTTSRDALESYAQYAAGGRTYIVGRQRVVKGESRLIGNAEWTATGRAWDGLRVSFGGWDAFYGKQALNSTNNNDASLAFLAKNHSAGETILIYKQDSRTAQTTRIYTLNHRLNKVQGTREYMVEGSLQAGRSAGLDVEAFAVSARAKWATKSRLSPFIEANVASGGGSATKVRTFDNLFPTNHPLYGQSDLQGLRNVVNLAVGADFKASKFTKVRLEWNNFSLFDASDAWYGASGAVNKRAGGSFVDPTGASGKAVGNELSLWATTTLTKHSVFNYGLSYFLPGKFIKSSVFNSGTNTKDQIWLVAQYSWKF
ncbi:MAG: alginate export family protein [Fimbriimonas sp.]